VLAINITVLVVCAASLLLCLRALLRAQLLRHETEDFLRGRHGWRLTAHERLEFLNLWYVMICINDVLLILASLAQLAIELRLVNGELWDLTSLLLGTGSLLVWFGLLRYLGFFRTYNVLILTMKGAAPNILRFLLCAGLLYAGFALAGWLILGPYHYKFSSLMTTSETLFSLINGDDMFASFDSFPRDKAAAVWVYSRVYLYLFVCLFTYVVLSLFISIIMDTYEIIKHCYERGFPVNR
jgi:mucolipin